MQRLLRHRSFREPQALRSHEERIQGIKAMFAVTDRSKVKGRKVLLIEDVITTGATLAAAVTALQSAEACRVDVLALARAPVWGRFRSRINRLVPPFYA